MLDKLFHETWIRIAALSMAYTDVLCNDNFISTSPESNMLPICKTTLCPWVIKPQFRLISMWSNVLAMANGFIIKMGLQIWMVCHVHYPIFSLKPNNLYVHSSLNKIHQISEITFLYQHVKNHLSSKFTGLFWGMRGPGN